MAHGSLWKQTESRRAPATRHGDHQKNASQDIQAAIMFRLLSRSLSLCVHVSDEVRKMCKKHREGKIYEFSHNNIFMAIKRHGSEL
jgi:hypothetical protein